MAYTDIPNIQVQVTVAGIDLTVRYFPDEPHEWELVSVDGIHDDGCITEWLMDKHHQQITEAARERYEDGDA